MNTPVCSADRPFELEDQAEDRLARLQRLARQAGVALVLLSAAVAALAWQARVMQDGPPRRTQGLPAPSAARWAAGPQPLSAPSAAPQQATATATAESPATPPPPTSHMHLDVRGWTLQAQGVGRGQLVQQLAQVSGSILNVAPGLLEGAVPVSLKGQRLSLAQAWQAVLGDDFSHAVLCNGQRCQVWITSALGRRTAPIDLTTSYTAGSVPAQAVAAASRVFTSDPPGLFTSIPADAEIEQTQGHTPGG